MKQKFNLKLSSDLPEDGFSLDELVIETKKMFETEGMVGFLRVLLHLLDLLIHAPMIGVHESNICCQHPHLVTAQNEGKKIMTSVGRLSFSWTRLKCKSCGKTSIPLRDFLNLTPYQPKTSELEKIVAEIVSEQSYRRSSQHIEAIGGIPIPHTRLHRWVMKSDCDKIDAKGRVQTLISDGTGYKKVSEFESNRGEVRLVIGVTKEGIVVPYGAWTKSSWKEIGKEIKNANHRNPRLFFHPIADMLVSDGEEGMLRGLKKLTKNQQRCIWHLPYELTPLLRYHDKASTEDSVKYKGELQEILEIHLPEEDFQEVSLEDRLELEKTAWEAENKVQELINELIEKGYKSAAKYLLNAKKNMFSYVRVWLKSGLVHPRVSSMIERMMREIGRRIKKIGFGWSPEGAAKMTRIIIKRITSANQWEQHWQEKLQLTGKLKISFLGCDLA